MKFYQNNVVFFACFFSKPFFLQRYFFLATSCGLLTHKIRVFFCVIVNKITKVVPWNSRTITMVSTNKRHLCVRLRTYCPMCFLSRTRSNAIEQRASTSSAMSTTTTSTCGMRMQLANWSAPYRTLRSQLKINYFGHIGGIDFPTVTEYHLMS